MALTQNIDQQQEQNYNKNTTTTTTTTTNNNNNNPPTTTPPPPPNHHTHIQNPARKFSYYLFLILYHQTQKLWKRLIHGQLKHTSTSSLTDNVNSKWR